jgi:hydrogenase maturation protease
MSVPTTYVLGLGNMLMGDDGFGPAAVRAFEAEYVVGPDVMVVDVGTPGLDLMPWLADVDRVIIVDTVKSQEPPGTLRVYGKTDVLRHPPSVRVGPHDPGVKEALLTLEFAGRAPRELVLIAVTPDRTEMAVHLSPIVESIMPRVVETIAATLEGFGATVRRRTRATPCSAWWTQPIGAGAPESVTHP